MVVQILGTVTAYSLDAFPAYRQAWQKRRRVEGAASQSQLRDCLAVGIHEIGVNAVPKAGLTPRRQEATKEFRKAVQALLPAGLSLENYDKEIERRIDGFAGDIAVLGVPTMEKVGRLLREIAKSRNDTQQPD